MHTPGSLHTLADIAERLRLTAWQLNSLRRALDGKAAMVDEQNRVLYRWTDIQTALDGRHAA